MRKWKLKKKKVCSFKLRRARFALFTKFVALEENFVTSLCTGLRRKSYENTGLVCWFVWNRSICLNKTTGPVLMNPAANFHLWKIITIIKFGAEICKTEI